MSNGKRKWFQRFLMIVLGLLLYGSFNLMNPAAAWAKPSTSLEITGDGVTTSVTYSVYQLQNMPQYQHVYSAINTWPSKKWYVGEGVKLRDLLAQAGIKDEATLIKFTATDGYTVTLTVQELLNDKRYYFPHLKDNSASDGSVPGSPEGAEEIEPILALVSAEGTDNPAYMNDQNSLLLMLGQRAVTEQTGNLFVKNVSKIEVFTSEPGKWDNPRANPDSGTVPAGTLVALSNARMDDDKIYYTTDGSTPTVNSPMYNWIASRWWTSREDDLAYINHPIEIKNNTIIKAITIGPGKRDSDVVTFSYQVTAAAPPVLMDDTTDNTVGREIKLTFTDDADWRGAISDITINGTSIGGQYSVAAGEITIDAGVFTAAGDYTIVVKATGYADAGVTQKILMPVTLTAPASGEEFKRGEQVVIRGTVVGTLTGLNITVTGPGGQTVYGPVAVQVTEGKFETSFTLSSDAAAGTYTITLEEAGLIGAITGTFRVQAGSGSGSDGPAGEVVLTITGDGVAREVEFTRAELEAMPQYQHVYSAINTWPTKKWYVGKGVKLQDLLNRAGMKNNAKLIRFTASDSYAITLTKQELLNDNRYYFPHLKDNSTGDGDGHIPGSPQGKEKVEPIVGLVSAEGTDNPAYMNDVNCPLLMLGQRAVTEQTGNLFVKNLREIEVLTTAPEKWDNPQADPGSGDVPAGTLVRLSNANMDDDKIYYTTDGTTPTLNSPMYNWIASRWWSAREDVLEEINHPIEINQDTTIKAITIGPGKEKSDVVTFTYHVKKAETGTAQTVTSGTASTVSLGSEAIVELSAGALKGSGAVEVKIEKVTVPPAAPAGCKLAGGVYEFSVGDKKSYTFAKKVTIKLSFDPNAVSPGESPAIYYYDEASGQWVNIGGTVSGNTVTVEVDHFTKFAVMVVAKETGKTLKDIAGHWALAGINKLLALGVVGGYPDGTFKPDATITRAEFATMLVKAFKLENKGGSKTFGDIAGHWAKDYIAGAVANGVLNGYDEKRFGPNDPVTREQMAVMIVKAAKLAPEAGETQFADHSSISEWARGSIAIAVKNGIMQGYPGNTFKPRAGATRAVAVTVIVNTLNQLNE